MPTMTPTAQPDQQTRITDDSRVMMLMLLDRIEHVTSDQLNGESKSGKLTVDRSQLDEVLANISQLKTMLQK